MALKFSKRVVLSSGYQ